MKPARLSLLGLVLVCAALIRAEPPEPPADKVEIDRREALARLHPGMNAADARKLLGTPRHVSRQILYGRYLEQWTYEEPLSLRIEFDWRKGQEKQILTVHAPTIRAP